MELPFDDDSFDAATMGYGLRNVTDKRRALAELRRVLRPGCRVAILVSDVPALLALCMFDDASTSIQDIVPVSACFRTSTTLRRNPQWMPFRCVNEIVHTFPSANMHARQAACRELGVDMLGRAGAWKMWWYLLRAGRELVRSTSI